MVWLCKYCIALGVTKKNFARRKCFYLPFLSSFIPLLLFFLAYFSNFFPLSFKFSKREAIEALLWGLFFVWLIFSFSDSYVLQGGWMGCCLDEFNFPWLCYFFCNRIVEFEDIHYYYYWYHNLSATWSVHERRASGLRDEIKIDISSFDGTRHVFGIGDSWEGTWDGGWVDGWGGGVTRRRRRERPKPKNDDYRYPSTHPVVSSFFNLLHLVGLHSLDLPNLTSLCIDFLTYWLTDMMRGEEGRKYYKISK